MNIKFVIEVYYTRKKNNKSFVNVYKMIRQKNAS